MWDFDFTRSVRAMVQTAPFILFRMAVYFAIALAYVLATGIGGAIGYGVTSFSDDGAGAGGFYGALIGFAGASGLLYFAREFILENQAGAATLKAKRRLGREHQIEQVGAKLRGMMSWINEGKIVD